MGQGKERKNGAFGRSLFSSLPAAGEGLEVRGQAVQSAY